MIWVSIQKRKPTRSDNYYWKGKGNCGGNAYYDVERNSFCFNNDVPRNKVDEDYLYWLDEDNAIYEERE